MLKHIEKIAKAQFKVRYENTILILNFNPLIKEIKELKLIEEGEHFSFIHFQARPKGLRKWGIYSSQHDDYADFKKNIYLETPFNLISLNENQHKNISPTSVIFVKPVDLKSL